MQEKEYTQVQIEKGLRDYLASIGSKNETFNDIISRTSGFKKEVKKEDECTDDNR